LVSPYRTGGYHSLRYLKLDNKERFVLLLFAMATKIIVQPSKTDWPCGKHCLMFHGGSVSIYVREQAVCADLSRDGQDPFYATDKFGAEKSGKEITVASNL
jgi:hypothetical protein